MNMYEQVDHRCCTLIELVYEVQTKSFSRSFEINKIHCYSCAFNKHGLEYLLLLFFLIYCLQPKIGLFKDYVAKASTKFSFEIWDFFTEHEASELRRTHHELKASLKVEPNMTSTQSSQSSPKRSPRPVRKILVDEKSPKAGDSNFPTRHTFMSDERLQSKSPTSSPVKARRILVDTGK